MAENSKIEWTDATWNPITGCSVVSPGCTNCYAMKLAGTRLANHPSRAGLTRDSKAGPVWTGEVRLNEQWLDQPLRWQKPRRIFVCAHSDLFHESVPDEWIDRVFAVMALASHHTFQVLTKRATRLRDYLGTRAGDWELHWPNAARKAGALLGDMEAVGKRMPWPLPNIWFGISAEDQTRADERIPHLLATPAAVRFVSAEPLLGPIDLTDLRPIDHPKKGDPNALTGRCVWPGAQLYADSTNAVSDYTGKLNWVIVGSESGPGARHMRNEWAQSIVDQCQDAGVAVFVKQLFSSGPRPIKDMDQFPEELRYREFPVERV